MKAAAVITIAGALGFTACRDGRGGTAKNETPSATATATATASATAIMTTKADAVAGDWIEKIALRDGGMAYVTPPVGAIGTRPIIVAIHGAVDDPGLMCSAWRLVADVYPFVVCPAGTPTGAKGEAPYVWGSSAQIAKRALEAAEAVEAKYPGHVMPGAPLVYAAFSQGANMAAPLLVRSGTRFPRAVLTEGGHHAFEPNGLALSYAMAGGQRVLFTCSQGGCAGGFALSRAALEHANVNARVVFSGAWGHSMPPPVRESIHAELAWVVDGLAGWEGYPAAPKLPAH